jgi:hypothetical protein
MSEQKKSQQDEREGGYGDDAGEMETPKPGGSNAAGRENPVTDSVDADEALGNRTGGYGGNPPSGQNPPRE